MSTDDVPTLRPRADDDARDPRPPRGDAPWASVTACPNGPLLVRGEVEILLADGRPAPRRRRTVALCRCGASAIKPYCDGSHKVVGFRTDDEKRTADDAAPDSPSPAPGQEPDGRGLRSA